MTLLYRDPIFLNHDTGVHPETPERLRSIDSQLTRSRLDTRCVTGTFQPVTDDALNQIHERIVLDRIQQLVQRGGGMLDADTVVSPRSFDVARAAAGACAAAVDFVLGASSANALCLVRPPGHHATQSQSMGFCLFNNVALAANRALNRHAVERILIVDFDVHHGNGTQDIFESDPRVLFLSIHRFGGGFYPGTGAADETGTGPGLGYTINVPIPFGTLRSVYHDAFRRALETAASRIKPQLVLVSAGFDAHALDPIGSLDLEVEDFARITREIVGVAESYCRGRLVSCLEGGYHLKALAESVQSHLRVLLGDDR